MKLKSIVTLILSLLCFFIGRSPVFSQSLEEYSKEYLIRNNDSLPYRLLLPKNYNKDETYPLILFLHGSGERGNDNELQLKHGASFFVNDSIRDNYPAIVVFPQCKEGKSWDNVKSVPQGSSEQLIFPTKHEDNVQLDLVEDLIKFLQKNYAIDKSQLFVGGLSMGGMGTFELVSRNPRQYAAAFAICGGAHPNMARRLKRTSWWIFHGDADTVIPPESSIQIYDALKSKNSDVKLTMYKGVGHDSWTNAFQEPGLMKWLFSRSKRLKR
ncbi:MAG: prolyl oligopeptidase family serine peptidase [Flavobacteriaceae bacterium]|nr:prolyl oligopeptidase family serine peptidase [Flavobacteriaceae bacterium]